MRIVLSLLLMTGAALAQGHQDAQPAAPTREEVERSVALCNRPELRLRKDQCDVVRNRLEVMKGNRDWDREPINANPLRPHRPATR